MSEITCATTRSRQRIQVQDHQSSPGFKHFQLVCGNEYVRIEAVYLLSWAILLQKYHGERDVCFPWRHIGAKQLGFWQQANAPGATILASLQEVTKRYYLSQEMKQERVNVNKPILFLDCDQDSQPQVCTVMLYGERDMSDHDIVRARTTRSRVNIVVTFHGELANRPGPKDGLYPGPYYHILDD